MVSAPALDLTTSLRGDFVRCAQHVHIVYGNLLVLKPSCWFTTLVHELLGPTHSLHPPPTFLSFLIDCNTKLHEKFPWPVKCEVSQGERRLRPLPSLAAHQAH